MPSGITLCFCLAGFAVLSAWLDWRLYRRELTFLPGKLRSAIVTLSVVIVLCIMCCAIQIYLSRTLEAIGWFLATVAMSALQNLCVYLFRKKVKKHALLETFS